MCMKKLCHPFYSKCMFGIQDIAEHFPLSGRAKTTEINNIYKRFERRTN